MRAKTSTTLLAAADQFERRCRRVVRASKWVCLHLLIVCLLLLLRGFVVDAALTGTSVGPISLVAGAQTDAVVAFVTSAELLIGYQVEVAFPDGFQVDVAAAQVVVSSNSYATTLMIASVTGSALTATVGSAAVTTGALFEFTITNIMNPAARTTDAFTISTYDSSGTLIDTDTTVTPIDIKASAFSLATLAPDSLEAGVLGAATLKFTSDVALPVGSALLLTFPSEFDVASSGFVGVPKGIGANSTVVAAAATSGGNTGKPVVTVTLVGTGVGVGGTVNFSVNGVTNPGAASPAAITGAFSLQSVDGAGRVYQEAPSLSGVVIVSTALSAVTLVFGSRSAGLLNLMTLTVSTAVTVPASGFVMLELPVEVAAPSTPVIMVEQSLQMTLAGSISDQKIKFKLPVALPIGSYTMTISGLRNPGVITTSSFKIATADFLEFILETGTMTGISVVAGLITTAQLSQLIPHPGITSSVEVSFTTSAQLDKDSRIQVELPSGDYAAAVPNLAVVVNSPTGVTAIASWDTHLSALLILISSAIPVPQGSSVSFTVTALRMPSSIRAQTTSAIIHTWNRAGQHLDGPDAITIQAVTAVSSLPGVWRTTSPHPGITSNAVLTFDISGAIPVGGQVVISLPASDFSAKDGPLVVALSSPTTGGITIDSALWDTASVSIILTLGGTTGIAAYTMGITMTISALDTPISVRLASRAGVSLTTNDQGGGVIDGPSTVTMDEIVAGLVLGTRTWVPTNPFAGVVSDQIVTFFNSGRLAGGSSIEIVMPDVKWSMAASDTVTVYIPTLGAMPAAMTWDAATRTLSIALSPTTATITVSSTISIQIPNVSNPPKETGICNAFLTTRAADGLIIDGPASISVMGIARGTVSGAMTWMSMTTTSASMLSDQVLKVTLSGALPSGSFLVITLPAGGWRFASSVPSATFSLPVSGLNVQSISWTLSSGELQIETLGDLTEGAAIELVVKDMVNPYSEQPSTALSLMTTLADAGVVDESTSSIMVNAIVSSALPQSGTWLSSVATPGVESTQTIVLGIGGEIEAGASVCFSLANADGWLVSFASIATLSVSVSYGVTQTALGEVTMSWDPIARVFCVVIPSAIAQESSIELQATKMRSPPSICPQQTADVAIRSHLGGLVNTGSVAINAVTKGALAGALLWQSLFFSPGPVADLLTSATLSFQSTGQILPGSVISLTLPIEWSLDSIACIVTFNQPIVVGKATCLNNLLTIAMFDIVDQYTNVEVLVSGVRNPWTVQPSGVAVMQTIAPDGGLIDDSASVVTGAIESALLAITSLGDARTAVVGVKKTFSFQGFNVAQGDVIKFVDASTVRDANCGDSITGVSDAGGLNILTISSFLDVQPTFAQASLDGQPFAICYKFGSNPFKLYPNLGFTIKEITSVSSNVGVPNMAVANYAKIWKFTGRGITTGDQVRWINVEAIQNVLMGSSGPPPDCTDVTTLAKLLPLPGVPSDVQEDDYTRNIAMPMSQVSLIFDQQNAGNAFCLCYKFGNEPFTVYPSIMVQVNHLETIKATISGRDTVAVVDAAKLFTFIGQGLLLNDRVYFIEAGTATNCAASSTNPALRVDHMLADQLQTVLFMSETLDTSVSFTAVSAGTKVLPCYQFGAEPHQIYPTILIEVKMVTRFLGTLGSSLLAVATVPEPLTFVGYGLESGDQVRWILQGEEDCESNLANLIAVGTGGSLDPIDTVVLDATVSGIFNFTDAQLEYNPLLCYKFGDEVFKLHTSLSIKIGTVWGKSTFTGEKEVAVVAARKMLTLYGMNLAEGDRVGWTTTPLTTKCAELSLLLANPTNLDNEYLSFTTSKNEVGVALAQINSGKRVYLCYGFGSEPLKLYANLYLDVKSILNMRSLLGSSDAAVTGALKTFLFDGDGVMTGDFAKFVPVTDQNCDAPGISLTNIMKEFDDYVEMAMYLYENIAGVTVGSFQFDSDLISPGLGRVLCYRFGIEPFFFYEYFHIDIKTIWALIQFDKTIGGQDDVAVVNERKLVTINGVGVSEKDQAKFVDASAVSDQDCVDYPAQGLFSQKITVFKNATMWYPFESSSNGSKWKLCYKFNDEPYRLYPGIGVQVKQLLDLWDFNALSTNVSALLLGRVATIGQVKTWLPVGSGVQQGDSVKFVSQSVQSSGDCGKTNANVAGGSSAMQVIISGSTLKSLVFIGTFTEFPSSLSDVYHLCYKFQDEPFSYIQGIELNTYGVLSIDRNTFLAAASTPLQLSGFRLSNTDQLGWTTSSTNCNSSSVFAITDVSDQKTIVWFPQAYNKLYLCYSFDRQPFAPFQKITVSIVHAEIWVPTAASVVADQQVEMTVAGTFGLTVSDDQIAWVPSDAIACSADLLTTYADVMETSVVSVVKSEMSIARGGSATFRVKFVAPVSGSTGALSTTGSGSSLATWKLCYRFGNMAEFLMFSDVLCEVLNIEQVKLLTLEPADLGSTMTFEFDGVGIQDFDAAKWVVVSDATIDSDCDALPAVGGSLTSIVINKLASYTFVQETSRMALCYKFQNHAFKLFSAIPIKDSSSLSSSSIKSSSSSSSTSSSNAQSTSPLTQFDDEREAAMSGALTPNRDVATVSLKIDMDINTIPAGSPAETQFKNLFTTTLSASLGIDSSRIQILELFEGSVIVKFQLLPSENVADPLVHEAIQDLQAQLTDPKSDLMKSGVVPLVGDDAASALSVSITSPPAVAPASISIQALGYQRSGLFTFVRGVYSITENTPTLIIPVVRLQGTDSIITLIVNFDPLKRTAIYNQDYTLPQALEDDPSALFLRFEIGEALQFIEIAILDDTVQERYFEYLTLTLADPGTPGAALGGTQETVVRLFDYGDGTELIRHGFTTSTTKSGEDPLKGWRVVQNGDNILRAAAKGIFSVDAVFGESEYDQQCDLASPTGECTYACGVGGGIDSALSAPIAERNVLALAGRDYVVSQDAVTSFPTEAFSLSLWVKTNQQSPSACLASYVMSSRSTASFAIPLALCNPSSLELLLNSKGKTDKLSTFINISDSTWHLLLVTWSSEDGRVALYDNGMLVFDGGPFRVHETLTSGGVFILGGLVSSQQQQQQPCAVTSTQPSDGLGTTASVTCNIDPKTGFVGKLQHVHLWSRVISRSDMMKELAWPLQVASNGLVFGWNFDVAYLTLNAQGRTVNDISTKGQTQKNLGFIHCDRASKTSCLVPGEIPRVAPGFPCGQVYTNIWHFAAPPEVLQALRRAYGGRLQFEMLAPSFNGSPRPRRGQISISDVAGNHISLAMGTFPLPSASLWTPYAVVLREDFGWIREPEGTPLAPSEFQEILGKAVRLWLRGDLWGYDASGQGQEAVYLDQVAIYAR